jgi:hypothetical protein
MNVKMALREKIWSHAFVDLSDLLFPNQSGTYSLSIQNTGSTQPSFSFAPKKSRQLSEAEWSRAMDIFVAIYCQKYPEEITAILTYVQQVKELMSMGANWQYFDNNFRLDREFTKCNWLDFRPDLETKAMLKAFQHPPQKKINHQAQPTLFRPPHFRVPPGFCFAYHQRGTRCDNSNCPYKHTCKDCGLTHPMYQPCPPLRSRQPNRYPNSGHNGRYPNSANSNTNNNANNQSPKPRNNNQTK